MTTYNGPSKTGVVPQLPFTKAPFVRSAYNYDRNKASIDSGAVPSGVSRTVQSQKDEADINVIVRRFGITGQLPQNVRVPSYQDFSEVFDFRSAMGVVAAAQQSFMMMPADVRARFGNDPHRFVEYASKEENLDEMRKMGLAIPKSLDIIDPVPRGTKEEKDHGSGDSKGGASVGEKAFGQSK